MNKVHYNVLIAAQIKEGPQCKLQSRENFTDTTQNMSCSFFKHTINLKNHEELSKFEKLETKRQRKLKNAHFCKSHCRHSILPSHQILLMLLAAADQLITISIQHQTSSQTNQPPFCLCSPSLDLLQQMSGRERKDGELRAF